MDKERKPETQKGVDSPSAKELKEKIKEYERLKEEYLSGWQRARADFLNYKNEEAERISEILRYAKERFILKLLPVLDSFERALQEVRSMKSEEKRMIEGFLQIKVQLDSFLKEQGVEEIKAMGENFDPNFHEAIEQIERKNAKPGTVIEVLEKGYTLHNRVIRPAKVKVAK